MRIRERAFMASWDVYSAQFQPKPSPEPYPLRHNPSAHAYHSLEVVAVGEHEHARACHERPDEPTVSLPVLVLAVSEADGLDSRSIPHTVCHDHTTWCQESPVSTTWRVVDHSAMPVLGLVVTITILCSHLSSTPVLVRPCSPTI